MEPIVINLIKYDTQFWEIIWNLAYFVNLLKVITNVFYCLVLITKGHFGLIYTLRSVFSIHFSGLAILVQPNFL
jgi:hypothetical protein